MDTGVGSAGAQQIKYLALRYPLRCSRIEELYFRYIEQTGREDFIGFELSSFLKDEYDIKTRRECF